VAITAKKEAPDVFAKWAGLMSECVPIVGTPENPATTIPIAFARRRIGFVHQ